MLEAADLVSVGYFECADISFREPFEVGGVAEAGEMDHWRVGGVG